MRVLIALDTTAASHAVVQTAASRPWPSDSIFCIANTMDRFFFGKDPALLEGAKNHTLEYLEQEAKFLANQGYKTETKVVFGNPRRAINHLALEWDADLVMVGSKGLTAPERVFLGSTAQAVLRHAPCSVEIVRLRAGDTVPSSAARILVATDGSACSLAAVRSIASRAWPKGTQIQVVSVPQLVFEFRQFPYVEAHEVERLNKESMEESRTAVAEAATLFSASGIQVSTEVPLFHEVPAKVILMQAQRWNADLIVLGSHGRGGFDRLVMGSVSEAVALHADCSVEVVREGQAHAHQPELAKVAAQPA